MISAPVSARFPGLLICLLFLPAAFAENASGQVSREKPGDFATGLVMLLVIGSLIGFRIYRSHRRQRPEPWKMEKILRELEEERNRPTPVGPLKAFSPAMNALLAEASRTPRPKPHVILERFDFPLHHTARIFVHQFAGLKLGQVDFSGETPNRDVHHRHHFLAAGLDDALPVADCLGRSLWITMDGRIYEFDHHGIRQKGENPHEGLQRIVMGEETPEHYFEQKFEGYPDRLRMIHGVPGHWDFGNYPADLPSQQASAEVHLATREAFLKAIPWQTYRHAYGEATDAPDKLRGLASRKKKLREQAFPFLWTAAHHQDYVSTATPAVIRYVILLLNDPHLADMALVDPLWRQSLSGFCAQCIGADSTPEIDAEIDQAFAWGKTVFIAESAQTDSESARYAQEVLDHLATTAGPKLRCPSDNPGWNNGPKAKLTPLIDAISGLLDSSSLAIQSGVPTDDEQRALEPSDRRAHYLSKLQWETFSHAYGSAEGAPAFLRNLTASEEDLRCDAVNDFLYSAAYHQCDVYTVTPWVIRYAAMLLEDDSVCSLEVSGFPLSRELIHFCRICIEANAAAGVREQIDRALVDNSALFETWTASPDRRTSVDALFIVEHTRKLA